MNKASFTFFCGIIISTFVQGQSYQFHPRKTVGYNKANNFKKNSNNSFWLPTLNDSTGNLQMVRLSPIIGDSLNPRSIISFLNKTDLGNETSHKIYLTLVKTSNDTIYLKIKNSFPLTQSIGTTGAMLYIAGVTYNLTELKTIKYVNLDFEEGDHAVPGTYSRDSFIDR
jgi:hypothetical protein